MDEKKSPVAVKDIKVGDIVEFLPGAAGVQLDVTYDPSGKAKYNSVAVGEVKYVHKDTYSYSPSGKSPLCISLRDMFSESGKYYAHEVPTKWMLPDTPIGHVMDEAAAKEIRIKFAKLRKEDWTNLYNPINSTGADPEIFVGVEGNIVPAWVFLPSKQEVHEANPKNHLFEYWDGFQAEFTTVQQSCHERFSAQIKNGLAKILKAAQAKNPKAVLAPVSVIEVEQGVLDLEDKDHVALGCEPSLNAYGLEPVEVDDPRKLKLRFAGGHLHFGLIEAYLKKSKGSKELYPEAVKMADLVGAIPVIAMLGEWEDPRRREFYGRAGEYRAPKHGIEYRVHSNQWLRHPTMYYITADLTRVGIWLGIYGVREQATFVTDEQIQKLINTTDVEGCRKLIRDNKGFFEKAFTKAGKTNQSQEMLFNVVQNGWSKYIARPNDLDYNWSLTREGGRYWQWSGAFTQLQVGGKI